jgi:hypothetical protein
VGEGRGMMSVSTTELSRPSTIGSTRTENCSNGKGDAVEQDSGGQWTYDVLMVVRVDVRGNKRAIRTLLAVRRNVDLQDSGEADLHLDAAILVEHVVEDVF